MKRSAIVRAPSHLLANGELTHQSRLAVDVGAAIEQHRRYVGLLQALGYDTVTAPALADHPDGVFVEDTLVVIGGTAVLTRPGAPSRRNEVDSMEPVIVELGRRIERITGDATLDGGDVMVTGRHVFVGLSSRTNAAAFDQITPVARRHGRIAVGVPVARCLHLKTGITELSDGSLIAAAGVIPLEQFRALGYRIRITDERHGANVLRLGDVNVVSADAPRTAALIAAHGMEVRPADIGEFHKVEAGLTCMSVLIDGDGPRDG